MVGYDKDYEGSLVFNNFDGYNIFFELMYMMEVIIFGVVIIVVLLMVILVFWECLFMKKIFLFKIV